MHIQEIISLKTLNYLNQREIMSNYTGRMHKLLEQHPSKCGK